MRMRSFAPRTRVELSADAAAIAIAVREKVRRV
jgi:hypothetical protein